MATVQVVDKIGDWALDALIGRGEFAEVYRARRADGQLAAIKLWRDTRMACDPQALADQYQALGAADVLPVYEVGRFEGHTFIATELIEGPSVEDRLGMVSAFSEQDAAEVALAIARRLERAHRAGMLHRDIKPSNVLLPSGAPMSEAKLIDFGLAGRLEDAHGNQTSGGMLVGTPLYMSPEQTRGEEQGPPTDVWALGALLFRMIFGRPPFVRDRMGALLHAINDASLEFPRPSALEPIIRKAMSKDPAERYSSASGIADALAAFLGARPAATRSRTPAVPRATLARPEARRPRGALPLVLLVLAVLGTVAAVALLFVYRTQLQMPPWLFMLMVAAIPGGAAWLVLRFLSAPARSEGLASRLLRVRDSAERHREFSRSIALSIDSFLDEVERTPAMEMMGASVALMMEDYREAKGGDRAQALGKAIEMLTVLEQRIEEKRKPWYIRHKDLLPWIAALTGLAGALGLLKH